jgi:hypothetical protein
MDTNGKLTKLDSDPRADQYKDFYKEGFQASTLGLDAGASVAERAKFAKEYADAADAAVGDKVFDSMGEPKTGKADSEGTPTESEPPPIPMYRGGPPPNTGDVVQVVSNGRVVAVRYAGNVAGQNRWQPVVWNTQTGSWVPSGGR